MIRKGVISDKKGSFAAVFLPENDNAVTAMLPFARHIIIDDVNIGDNCVVSFFESDNPSLANGVIIAIY